MSGTGSAPRVVVVGSGPAGTRAAETLVAAGLRPIVVDEGQRSGGQIYRRQPAGFRRSYAELYGTEAARAQALHDTFDRLTGRIDYRPNALAWNVAPSGRVHGAQDGAAGVLHVAQEGVGSTLPYDALIIASGATDRLLPVEGWSQAGVFSLGAMQVALKSQGCALGSRIVFLGTGPLLYLVAAQYAKAGADVAAVLDTSTLAQRMSALPLLLARPDVLAKGVAQLATLRRLGVPVHHGVVPVRIEADAPGSIVAVQAKVDGRMLRVDCDAVGLGFHLRPETQLADLAGCAFDFDRLTRQWFPVIDDWGRTTSAGVYLAGDGVRILGADGAEIAGRLSAHAVLADLGRASDAAVTSRLLRRRRTQVRFAQGLAQAFPWPHQLAQAVADETVLCRCENVTAGEVRRSAAQLDAAELNRSKSFSRVGMGRCQGRYCAGAAAEILAATLQRPVDEVGRLRGQAPVKPLSMATVAAGPGELVA